MVLGIPFPALGNGSPAARSSLEDVFNLAALQFSTGLVSKKEILTRISRLQLGTGGWVPQQARRCTNREDNYLQEI